jgi:hypothetical protein
MALLPKTKHPIYELKIPSTQKTESFRPFLVKEEKILLMAKQSDDPTEIFRGMKQIINNCALDKKFDVNKLAIFDLEFLFLRLRAISVNNIAKVSYKDNEDGKIYDFDIDLNTIEVTFPENFSSNIKITDDTGIIMKFPAASLFDDKEYFKSGDDSLYELILRCIDKVYDAENVYFPSDFSREELDDFLDNIEINVYKNIMQFMENTPKLYHKLYASLCILRKTARILEGPEARCAGRSDGGNAEVA